jgi:hypothetical protein
MDNRQGGHKLLHLGTGKVITRPRVKEIPMSITIIRAVENMARCQGVKQLKFTHRDGTPFEPANYIAGVDDDSNDEEDKDYEYESESDDSSDDNSMDSDSDSDSDFDSDDEGPPELVRRDDSSCSNSGSESSSEDEEDDDFFNTIDRIDREEVYDILMESKSYERDERASNIIDSMIEVETVQEETTEDHDENPVAETAGVAVSNTDSQGTYKNQRSTQERKEPTRYDPAKEGLTQTIATKKVKFKARDILEDLKHCHNMIGREPGELIEYETVIAGVDACHIHNHNEKALNNGACFGQQHILQKGLKTFGEKGKKAALKEMKQLML